jgi:hypothetical protein
MKENLTKTISMNGLGVIEEETTYNNQIDLMIQQSRLIAR